MREGGCSSVWFSLQPIPTPTLDYSRGRYCDLQAWFGGDHLSVTQLRLCPPFPFLALVGVAGGCRPGEPDAVRWAHTAALGVPGRPCGAGRVPGSHGRQTHGGGHGELGGIMSSNLSPGLPRGLRCRYHVFHFILRSRSISLTGAQGIPKDKIGLGRGKDGRVGEGLVEGGGGGLTSLAFECSPSPVPMLICPRRTKGPPSIAR